MAKAKLLSVSEIVNSTGRGRSTVYADIKSGFLPSIQTNDGLRATASAVKTYDRSLQAMGR